MKKNAIVLLGDYWHPAETIEPLLPMILSKDHDIMEKAHT